LQIEYKIPIILFYYVLYAKKSQENIFKTFQNNQNFLISPTKMKNRYPLLTVKQFDCYNENNE